MFGRFKIKNEAPSSISGPHLCIGTPMKRPMTRDMGLWIASRRGMGGIGRLGLLIVYRSGTGAIAGHEAFDCLSAGCEGYRALCAF